MSTKIGRVLRRPFGPGAINDQWLGGLEFQTVFDYGYDGVMRSFEDSLQRLGINRVDVLLIHDLDPWDHNPPALDAYFGQLKTGGWRALSELREAGIIKGIGAGFNSMGVDPALSRPLRHRLLPAGDALHAARTGGARERVPALRRARRRHHHRRRLQFGDSRDRRRSGRNVQLRARGAGHSRAGRARSRRSARATTCRCRPPRSSFRSATRSSPRSFPARFRAPKSSRTSPPSAIPFPPDLWAELKHEKLIRADAPTPG